MYVLGRKWCEKGPKSLVCSYLQFNVESWLAELELRLKAERVKLLCDNQRTLTKTNILKMASLQPGPAHTIYRLICQTVHHHCKQEWLWAKFKHLLLYTEPICHSDRIPQHSFVVLIYVLHQAHILVYQSLPPYHSYLTVSYCYLTFVNVLYNWMSALGQIYLLSMQRFCHL